MAIKWRSCLDVAIRLLKNADLYYRNASVPMAVLALLLATYIVILPHQLFVEIFESLEVGHGSSAYESAGFIARMFIGSIVAPFIETLLFQWAPIRLLHGVFGLGAAKTIFISGSLFAATHTYSLGYVVFSFLVGLVLAYGFLGRNYPDGRASLIVFSAHALRNFVATLARSI